MVPFRSSRKISVQVCEAESSEDLDESPLRIKYFAKMVNLSVKKYKKFLSGLVRYLECEMTDLYLKKQMLVRIPFKKANLRRILTRNNAC